MKNSFYLILLTIILISYGCPNEPDPNLGGNLEIVFETEFNGQQFFTGQEYAFPDGRKVRFSKLDFYVADIAARVDNGGVGETVDLAEVEFIDQTGSQVNPVNPFDAMVNAINLPAGDYTNLSFTFGLSPELNSKTPNDADLGSENPLKKSSHYWNDWSSYIFLKVEGNADFDGDGIIGGEETFIYHTGQSGVEQSVNLSADFTISEDATTNKKLSLDLQSFFYNSNGESRFDMSEFRSVHSDIALIETIMEGAADGIRVKE